MTFYYLPFYQHRLTLIVSEIHVTARADKMITTERRFPKRLEGILSIFFQWELRMKRNLMSNNSQTNTVFRVTVFTRAIKRMHILRVCKRNVYSVSDLDYLFNSSLCHFLLTVLEFGVLLLIPNLFSTHSRLQAVQTGRDAAPTA